MGVRTADGMTPAAVSDFFRVFLQIHDGMLLQTAVLGLEYSLKGSNVRLPATYSGLSSFGGGSQDNNDRRARFISYTGRSADGHKVRLFLFGPSDISQGDYRVSAPESAIIAAAVTNLNAATDHFLTISSMQASWHAYANVGFHDHWIKEYRKG